jgi:hypothetical protein
LAGVPPGLGDNDGIWVGPAGFWAAKAAFERLAKQSKSRIKNLQSASLLAPTNKFPNPIIVFDTRW